MANVTPKTRTIKAFQWTGFAVDPAHPSAALIEMLDVLRGIQVEVRHGYNTLVINAPPLGKIDVWPTRDVPEHVHEGRTIPAQTIQGQWVTRDEDNQIHVWDDAAFRAAFS